MLHNISRSILYLGVFVSNLPFSDSQEPSVNLPQGRIIGTKVYTDRSLTPIEIYYGIPYANPPTGRYRFAAPERHSGWRRVLQAHRIPPSCPSTARTDSNFSEDCLFLNVWTSRHADGSTLPVLIILHSESWAQGGQPLPCQDIAAEGIVVVTVSFRLHVLAFFTLRSIAARGNLALLDQYLAFLWVRENIAAFGGDPNMITVLGHSAGADSVLHHLVSPRVYGLFQRAIVMSPQNIWKLADNGVNSDSVTAENYSRVIASAMGCKSQETTEVLRCMRSLSLADILTVFSNSNWTKWMQPVPESYLPEAEQFLPTSLPSALSSPKQSVMNVDLLMGTTDLEALNYNDESFEELLKWNASYVTDHVNTKTIPKLLEIFNLPRSELLVRAVRWEYWIEKNWKGNYLREAIELLARIETSAKWSAAGALLAAKLARRVSQLYVYRYSQPTNFDLQGRQLNYSGAVHGSDLIALLGDALVLQVARRPATSDERKLSTIFRRYVVNFVKYGSPENINHWRRYKAGDAYIHEIQNEDCAYKNDVTRDVKFWLQYLPELSSLFKQAEQTEQLASHRGDERLRGGVFAMCGVAVVLLLLLCVSAGALHRQRMNRRLSITDHIQK